MKKLNDKELRDSIERFLEKVNILKGKEEDKDDRGLKRILLETTDMRRLMYYLDTHMSYNRFRRQRENNLGREELIKERIIKVLKKKLPKTTDIYLLKRYLVNIMLLRKSADPPLETEELILAKIIEVLKKKLPEITDMNELSSLYRDFWCGDAKYMIEGRMVEVVKEREIGEFLDFFKNPGKISTWSLVDEFVKKGEEFVAEQANK
ncbi:hypothetical protein KAS79_03235 [Candidatus Parcubacteria bacterium]|nr:hypothetical protein [Candidatus Parcubacteria bacterium]